MKTIEERINEISIEIGCNCADFYSHEIDFNVIEDGLMQIATEQKTIDEKYIKLLEEDRNAFIAFCHNIINGRYISVIDAAKEQLGYLEIKVMEK